MGVPHTPRWKALERWSPTLFLAAGGVLLVFAALNGVAAFTNRSVEYNGFEGGYVLGFLGLLGLYRSVADRSPWLALAGGVAALAGVVGISAITVIDLSRLAGVTTGTPPGWSLIVFLSLVGFVLGYCTYGVGVLRTDRYSSTVGLLLVLPGVIVILMIAHIAAGYASDQSAFVISTGQAMAHIAIGASLRTKSLETERNTWSSDPDVEVTTHE